MRSRFFKLLIIAAVALILIIRLWIGLSRFFDPDEFSHMHWGYLMKEGLVPFRDFFYNYTPPFSLVFSLLIFVFGEHSTTLLAGRVFIFLLSATTLFLIYRIADRLFGKKVAVLSFFLAATYPIALDKSIEFRSDNLMLTLFLIGYYLLAGLLSRSDLGKPDQEPDQADQGPTLTTPIRPLFLSGFFVGLSVVVLLKGVVFAAGLFPLVLLLGIKRVREEVSPKWKNIMAPVLVWTGGVVVSWLSLAGLFLLWGVLPLAYEFLFPINYEMFHAYPHFSPFAAFEPQWGIYGTYGEESFERLFNIGLWVISIAGVGVMGIRIMQNSKVPPSLKLRWAGKSPAFAKASVGRQKYNSKVKTDHHLLNVESELLAKFLLLFIPFSVGVVAIFYLFHLPFLQYFLILLPFISVFAAYFLVSLGESLNRISQAFLPRARVINFITIITFITIIFSLLSTLEAFYLRSKFKWRSFEDFKVLDFALDHSEKEDRFYDMTGSYVFRKDGYFECCVAFTDYKDKISYPMPDFITQMKERETKFVIRERNARLFGKFPPREKDFIEQNYVSTLEVGNVMAVGRIFDFSKGPVAFEVFVPGEYLIWKQDGGGGPVSLGEIFVDGKSYKDNLFLTKGVHTVSASGLPRATLIWNYRN